MPTVPKFMIHFNLLFVVAQGPTNRGPTDPNRSEIFKILLVLVRSGTIFGNFSWSWSGQVPGFRILLGPVAGLEICLGPGSSPVQVLKLSLVLVQSGPRFHFFCSVRDLEFLKLSN